MRQIWNDDDMTVTPIKTKAEQQLATQFEAAAPQLPGGGWVPAARRAAFARFAAEGLPHRRLEAWKYTDLRASIKDVPAPAPRLSVRPKLQPDKLLAALGPELAGLLAHRFIFVNGMFVQPAAPEDHEAGSFYEYHTLAEALDLKRYEWMTRDFEASSGTAALNAAFVTDGILLRVIAAIAPSVPIHLVFLADSAEPEAVATRNLIRFEKGARATLIESHVAVPGAVARQANAMTYLHLHDGADVEHIKLLAEGPQATHLGGVQALLEAGANYRAFQFSESPLLARNDVNVTFKGEGANLTFGAVMLGRGKSHIDTTMVIDHAVPGCTSRELVKAVLEDDSRGVFQGKVIVRPDAQKSDGKQSARALLLSPTAEFDSKPELEIYADDVICGHGSTAAELDEDQVFYLMARGIPRAEARALLIEAFAAEAIEAIAHEGIREAMRGRLQGWLAGAKP